MHLRFIVATVAATLVFAPNALAGPCGLPDAKPLWVDYAESSVAFRDELFRRPGLVLASSGTTTPQSLRDGGAQTVYWQMKLIRFVGTPSEPTDAGTVAAEAAELLDRAAASSGCATPLIALEEMWGADLPTPWSPSNSAYRTNVLELARQLSARGARPFLFVHGNLELRGAAGAWWQQLSASADIVYESYFDAPRTYALGIDPARLGLILGFHSKPGTSGREGLQPLGAWLQFVKLNALAAREVAGELGLGSIWSWGWGTFDAAGADPDKPLAACAYLWTRDQSLCDAPARAAFDTSLTDGQLILPEGVQCAFPAGMVPEAAVARLAPFAGSRRAALTALVARRALRGARVRARDITRTESSLVSARYGGSYARYRRALAHRGLTRADAVAILTDALRARHLGARAARVRLAAAADSALCLRDELPARDFVDLAKKL